MYNNKIQQQDNNIIWNKYQLHIIIIYYYIKELLFKI